MNRKFIYLKSYIVSACLCTNEINSLQEPEKVFSMPSVCIITKF